MKRLLPSNHPLLLFFFLFCLGLFQVRAVEVVVNGTDGFNTTAPTSSDIPNWSTGWGSASITGWNYVGVVNDASGVYLGDNWVLTAAHVTAGDFLLGGSTYDMVPGSAQYISGGSGTADLVLFQLATAPILPSLAISFGAPVPYWVDQNGSSSAAMIGYGGTGAETWGYDTVTGTDDPIQVNSFHSTDFETNFGVTSAGPNSITNNAWLVHGDSGGGVFIYNGVTNQWELAGINESVDVSNDSYMIQLSTYASKIAQITGIPEPTSFLLAALALPALLAFRRRQQWRRERHRSHEKWSGKTPA